MVLRGLLDLGLLEVGGDVVGGVAVGLCGILVAGLGLKALDLLLGLVDVLGYICQYAGNGLQGFSETHLLGLAVLVLLPALKLGLDLLNNTGNGSLG